MPPKLTWSTHRPGSSWNWICSRSTITTLPSLNMKLSSFWSQYSAPRLYKALSAVSSNYLKSSSEGLKSLWAIWWGVNPSTYERMSAGCPLNWHSPRRHGMTSPWRLFNLWYASFSASNSLAHPSCCCLIIKVLNLDCGSSVTRCTVSRWGCSCSMFLIARLWPSKYRWVVW